MAGQGAFGWLPDIARMGFSSVLWVGPPNASPLWQASPCGAIPAPRRSSRATTTAAPCGSPQATDAAEIAARHRRSRGRAPACCSCSTRPIRSCGGRTDLLFTRPDWLKEPPGRDRTASMRWYPIVTFWQVAADMTNAAAVPGGHGHNYGDFGARRLGGRRAARRLDAGGHRTHPHGAGEVRSGRTGPNTNGRQRGFVARGARWQRTGRRGKRWWLSAARRWAVGMPRVASGPLGRGRRLPCSPEPRWGCARLRCGRALRLGLAAAAAAGGRRRGDDGAAPVRAAMADRGTARRAGALAAAGHPVGNGVAGGGRLPRARWARSPADAFGPAGGRRRCSRRHSGCRTSPTRAPPAESVVPTVLATGRPAGCSPGSTSGRAASPRRCSRTWPSTRPAPSRRWRCRTRVTRDFSVIVGCGHHSRCRRNGGGRYPRQFDRRNVHVTDRRGDSRRRRRLSVGFRRH